MKGCFEMRRLILTVLMSVSFTCGLNLFINCCNGKYDEPSVYVIGVVAVVFMLSGLDFGMARYDLDSKNVKLNVEVKREQD